MDDSAAHRLPIEIWVDVANTLRDSFPCSHGVSSIDGDPCTLGCDLKDYRSIQPLTRVCRYLYNAIQPILFEFISLSGFDATKMTNLASTLADRPDLRSAVRGLELEGFHTGNLSDAFLQVLPRLTEIRFLSLKSGTINPAIVQLLKNAIHLHTLHMTYFTWGQDVPENWSSHEQFGPCLKSLVLNDFLAPRSHHIPKCSNLLAPSLTSLHVTSAFIFKYMKTLPILPFGSSLIKLYTHVENAHQDAFINFVYQCPNIEHLEISGVLLGLNPGPDFLPRLRSIDDFSYLVKLLLPGRPIRSIRVYPEPALFAQPLLDLEAVYLSRLAADEGGMKILEDILENCPGLLRLEITSVSAELVEVIKEWIRTGMTSDIAALPRLQVLCIKTNKESPSDPLPIEYPLSEEMLQEREMMVRMRRESCPDLYDVWLHPEHAWRYLRFGDAWVPTRRIMRA